MSELLLCGLLALALGAAMAWRLVLDGPSDQRLLTGVMAALFALVIGAVAYLSYQSEFADGSTTTEAIDVLAPQLHGTHRTEEALRAKREILLRQAARLTARLARDCARLRAEAERRVVESTEDRAVRYARSVHQHCGYGSALPGPRLSLGDLDLALAQARSWTDTEAVPAVAVGGEGQDEQGDEGLAVVA
ncbi:hypothetical protein IQ61_13165 [Streptomyces scabiei]|nr:hypothetical protein IQ61_13165 [Streptomyces scabiei]